LVYREKMSSVVQHGQRRGPGKSAENTNETIGLPDLHQTTVLTKADWSRIQDEINRVDKEKERMMEATRQREALHLKSKQMAKLWPNTLACQRQKKLEAKKIRDQVEEDKRKQIDMEEAKYREEKRKEAIEKAKTQLYYETERVKGLHRALLLTEVLKEREAQIELKQRKKSAFKDLDEEHMQMLKAREDEALTKEQERTQQKKQESKAFAEELMKENQLERERRKHETKKDGEEIQRLQELHQWEQKMEEQSQARQKKEFMNDQLVGFFFWFLLLREVQIRRERIMDKLMLAQQEQKEQKQQNNAEAVAERDAQRMQREWEEEQKRVQMMKSIAAHREHVIQEKERNELIRKEKEREVLQAKKEGDRIFGEEQQKKSQRIQQELRKIQDFNASQMVNHEQDRPFILIFVPKLLAEEELGFERYSRAVVQAAASSERNVLPLYKAVREGVAGGPAFIGARPRYLVQDSSGAEMPKYVSDSKRDIKKIHQVEDIEEAKKRLGFTWF
uniref:Cilia and flagella associated protein 210 n=1 Tax=Hippocampus comes TaxID=109280 RepID=A0A3Q2ZLD1_HIPCM